MIGGAFLLCNLIMLIMYECNPDILYSQFYPILSAISALTTVTLVIPTVVLCKEDDPNEKSNEKADLIEEGDQPQEKKKQNVFYQLYDEFRHMHKIFYLVMLPLLIGWISYTPL